MGLTGFVAARVWKQSWFIVDGVLGLTGFVAARVRGQTWFIVDGELR